MMARQNIDSGTPWEAVAGYSRAVRVGELVFVSGTTAHDEQGQLHGGDDAYAQAACILKKIAAALKQVGARFRNEIITGMGGQQILLEDPAGNPIELFQPGRR